MLQCVLYKLITIRWRRTVTIYLLAGLSRLEPVHCFIAGLSRLGPIHCFIAGLSRLEPVHCFIAGLSRLEPVHCCIAGLSRLDFLHIHLLLILKCIKCVQFTSNTVFKSHVDIYMQFSACSLLLKSANLLMADFVKLPVHALNGFIIDLFRAKNDL